jgi:hydrogenase maturation protease
LQKPLKKILLYAYGNPGRQDDGLGNMFIEEMEEWIREQDIDYIETDSNYQLNIEDAYAISGKEIVIFIDASTDDIDGFHFSEVEPSGGRPEFTMHSASPAFILALCHKIYKAYPRTYLLQIKGYEWNFREGISDRALKNLSKALDFITEKLRDKDFLGPPASR